MTQQEIESYSLFYLDEGPDICWEWSGRKNGNYGVYRVTLPDGTRQTQRAHRLMYSAVSGSIPEGGIVHHTCFNAGCVNPNHLALVTLADHLKIHAGPRSHAVRSKKEWDKTHTTCFPRQLDKEMPPVGSFQETSRLLKDKHPRDWFVFLTFWVNLWTVDSEELRSTMSRQVYSYRRRCLKRLHIPFPLSK